MLERPHQQPERSQRRRDPSRISPSAPRTCSPTRGVCAPEAGPALGDVAVVTREAGPGDVEVPWHVADELLQEEPAVRVPPSRPGVLMSATAESIPRVVRRQRQRPHPLADPIGCVAHLRRPVVVVAHKAAILSPSATTHAGERGEVDDRGGLSSTRATTSARMRRPSASVLSTSTVLPFRMRSLTRTDRRTARHVLDQRHVAGDLGLHSEVLQRRHRGDDGRATRHVALHRLHAAGRLE